MELSTGLGQQRILTAQVFRYICRSPSDYQLTLRARKAKTWDRKQYSQTIWVKTSGRDADMPCFSDLPKIRQSARHPKKTIELSRDVIDQRESKRHEFASNTYVEEEINSTDEKLQKSLNPQLTKMSTGSSLPTVQERGEGSKVAEADDKRGKIEKQKPWWIKYFRPPILRQLWGSEQKIAWFELFYDLIYVALAINLSSFLKENKDLQGVFTAFLYFVQLFYAWNSLTMFVSRFLTRDMYGTFFKFLYSSAVLFMNVFVLDGLDASQNFSIGAAVSRACLVMLYAQVYFLVPRASKFAKAAIVGNAVSTCLFVIAGFTQVAATILLWLIAVGPVEVIWVWYTYRTTQASIPVNVEHISERYGLFIMLMHGESIIAIGTDTSVNTTDDFIIVFWGFVIVFAMHFLYYGSLPKEPEEHALRISANRGRTFVYAHIFTGFSLIALGTAISELKKAVDAGKNKGKRSSFNLFALSVVLFLISCNVIRVTHNFPKRSLPVWVFRKMVLVVMIVLPFVASSQFEPEGIVRVYAILMVVLVNVEAIGSNHEEEESNEEITHLNQLPLPPKELKVQDLKTVDLEDQTYRGKSIDETGSRYFRPPLKRQGGHAKIGSSADLCYL
eukprot:jgi/Bigna1/130550/aug1.11_g5258